MKAFAAAEKNKLSTGGDPVPAIVNDLTRSERRRAEPLSSVCDLTSIPGFDQSTERPWVNQPGTARRVSAEKTARGLKRSLILRD